MIGFWAKFTGSDGSWIFELGFEGGATLFEGVTLLGIEGATLLGVTLLGIEGFATFVGFAGLTLLAFGGFDLALGLLADDSSLAVEGSTSPGS